MLYRIDVILKIRTGRGYTRRTLDLHDDSDCIAVKIAINLDLVQVLEVSVTYS